MVLTDKMIKDVTIVLCIVCSLWMCTGIQGNSSGFGELNVQPMWNSTYTDMLRTDLFKHYDRNSRPSQHYNRTLVQFTISIRHIEVSEEKANMVVYAWMTVSWEDTKLKWDPSDYGGLGVLHVYAYELWKPDLYLYNSMVSTPIYWTAAGMQVYPSGHVFWIVPGRLAALCDLDLTYWPYDSQSCSFKIGSWTSSGDEIDLGLMNGVEEADVSEIITKNNQWQITKTSLTKNLKFYNCCEEGYPDIQLTVNVTRNSPASGSLIVTPAIVVITSTLISFWISPHGNAKLVTEGFTAIVVCSMLLYFTQKLPAMGDHVPLIMSFYSSCLYILSIAMIESTVVIWMTTSSHSRPLPWIIKKPLTGKFGSVLGVSNYVQKSTILSNSREEEMRDHQVTNIDPNDHPMITSSNEASVQQEWSLLATAIDRIFFIIFCFVFFILTISHSL